MAIGGNTTLDPFRRPAVHCSGRDPSPSRTPHPHRQQPSPANPVPIDVLKEDLPKAALAWSGNHATTSGLFGHQPERLFGTVTQVLMMPTTGASRRAPPIDPSNTASPNTGGVAVGSELGHEPGCGPVRAGVGNVISVRRSRARRR